VHDFQRRLARRMRDSGLLPLGERAVLDVGCGSGGLLRALQEMGGPARFVGVDLSPERLASARRAAPHHAFALADGTSLPFADASFDLVCQSTVLSSILDDAVRARVAAEMRRILRPKGAVLWYDLIWNPLNRATRGLGKGDVARLFPGFRLELERATLAPPLARLVASRSHLVATVLTSLPVLRGHYVGLLRREL
jgi:ubiquinone/menaquinone biosynthesis C-methylase UbiE